MYGIVQRNKFDFEISKRMNFVRNNLEIIWKNNTMCFFIANNICRNILLTKSSNFHKIKFTG